LHFSFSFSFQKIVFFIVFTAQLARTDIAIRSAKKNLLLTPVIISRPVLWAKLPKDDNNYILISPKVKEKIFNSNGNSLALISC